MAAWTGWDTALLHVIGEPDTSQNRVFLDEWEKAEHTTCAFNPLSSTVAMPHSTRCKELSNGEYAQAYRTRQDGLSATSKRLHDPAFVAILAVLRSGDPFSYGDWQEVVGALGTWGAHNFAAEYAKALKGVGSLPSPTDVINSNAARSLHAYHHFSTVLARDLPTSLYRARKQTRHALSLLHR